MGNIWEKPLPDLVGGYDAQKHPIGGPLLRGGPIRLATAIRPGSDNQLPALPGDVLRQPCRKGCLLQTGEGITGDPSLPMDQQWLMF
jgi:hypothetical protein